MSRPIAYEPHPVTPERKAELVGQGFQIIDAAFEPAKVRARGEGAAPAADLAAVRAVATGAKPAAKSRTAKQPPPGDLKHVDR